MQPEQAGRRLYLLRHAKSDWDDPAMADEDRPLAPRGRRAAALLVGHFRAAAVTVDLVLCSPAVRARQTWDGVRSGLPSSPEVRIVDALYGATPPTLLEVVRSVEPTVGAVLVIGHNPGIEEFGARLAGSGDRAALVELRRGFPTGGFATLRPAHRWADLEWGSARLEAFVRPRDLAAGE